MMQNLFNKLMSSTAISTAFSYAATTRMRSERRFSKERNMRPATGILLREKVEVPTMSDDDLAPLDMKDIETVTRHFKEEVLERTLKGSFVFGTIQEYQSADTAQIGRFSDWQEGLQREVFKSRTNIYTAKIGGLTLTGVGLIGDGDDIAIQYEVNDFCSCSSLGAFNPDRANLLRNRGNPDVSAYAVYDFKKLRQAITEILAEDENRKHLKALARKVNYGKKDRLWEIERGYKDEVKRDNLAIWLGTTFVKSPDYEHEDEIRLLLIDPHNIGALDTEAKRFILADPRISGAIIDHGMF